MKCVLFALLLQDAAVRLQEFEAQLSSRDAATVVRACTEVTARQSQQVASNLLGCYLDPVGRDDDQRDAVRRSALDAMILLNSEVPPDFIQIILEDYPAQGTILALRDVEANLEALRGMVRSGVEDDWRPNAWRAASNALLARTDPQLAEALLASLTLELRVQVFRPTDVPEPGMGGMFGRGAGRRVPVFPNFADYQLVDSALAGAKLLAEGPVKIYSRRKLVSLGKRLYPDLSSNSFDIEENRLMYLRGLAWTEKEDFPLEAKVERGLRWRDEEDFVQRVRGWTDRIREDHRALVDRLIEAGHLPEGRRPAVPFRLEVRFTDSHGASAKGLPDAFEKGDS